MKNDFKNTPEIKKFIEDYVRKIGFSVQEAKIYSTLVKYRQLPILAVARKTGIERSRIYTITDKMLSEGYVEQVSDYKRKFLKPCDLSKVQLLAEKKISEMKFVEDSQKLFEKYVAFFKTRAHPINVRFYRGIDGQKQAFWNLLKTGKEIKAFLYKPLLPVLGRKFFQEWASQISCKNIEIKELVSDSFFKNRKKNKSKDIQNLKTKRKYIPSEVLNIRETIYIYNDVVTIFRWNKGEVFGLGICDKNFSRMQSQFFKALWKQGIDWKKVQDDLEYKRENLNRKLL